MPGVRYFSLAAERLGKPPASLLSLPCSSMPQAPLPSGGTGETEMGSLMSPVFQKNWNIFSVIWFYRIQIFNSTNTGLEDGSTGLRTGYSGQEELLL